MLVETAFSKKNWLEVIAFDVDNGNKYDEENRLAELEVVPNICFGLVMSVDFESKDHDEGSKKKDNISTTSTSSTKTTMVRLAHFSVKEYLVSDRIRAGSAASFSIDEKVSNALIGETSLSCLQLYDEASFSDSKETAKEFPRAKYQVFC